MSAFLSHVDVRVRNRKAATEFYDALLGALGAVREVGEKWTSWQLTPDQWFGITEDPDGKPGSTRVAFTAPSRGVVDTLLTLLPIIGAVAIEPPDDEYGPDYYACFFNDPDGNAFDFMATTRTTSD